MEAQAVVAEKSVASAGVVVVATALVKEIAELLLLVRVTVCVGAAVPTAVELKESVVAESVSDDAVRFSEAINASESPSSAVWNEPVVDGRFDEKVCPVMNTFGSTLKAIPNA